MMNINKIIKLTFVGIIYSGIVSLVKHFIFPNFLTSYFNIFDLVVFLIGIIIGMVSYKNCGE